MKTGLVLEGGGMRGIYTAGVLDALTDANVFPDYVIGVSAGATNGVSYVSGQRGRSRRVNLDYLDDKRYMGLNNLILHRSMFNMDFLFGDITEKLDPFDFDAFIASPIEFITGVTDANTGKPAYFDKSHLNHETTVLRASASIPMFSPIVRYQGGEYLDGGTTDPIPFEKALADGCERIIVVLTRHREYVKSPEPMHGVYARALRRHPAMVRALEERHLVYAREREALFALEKEGRAIVLAPKTPLALSRFEKNREKLEAAYEQGMRECREMITARESDLRAWGMLR